MGIVRTDKRLQRAMHRVQLLKQEVHEYYSHYRVGNDLIELRNLIEVADLIIRSALLRRESRGLHFNLDHPEAAELAKDTILFPGSVEHLDLMRPYLERVGGALSRRREKQAFSGLLTLRAQATGLPGWLALVERRRP